MRRLLNIALITLLAACAACSYNAPTPSQSPAPTLTQTRTATPSRTPVPTKRATSTRTKTPYPPQTITPSATQSLTLSYETVDPNSPGFPGMGIMESLYKGLEAILDPSNQAVVEAGDMLLVPWYTSSSQKGEQNLHKGSGEIIPQPDYSHFMMVSDELSEVALLASLGTDDEAMRGLSRTLEAMAEGSAYGSLPVWVAEVRDGTIIAASADTASDATARAGLALFQAARNESFPISSRTDYLRQARQMLEDHVKHEFIAAEMTSPITGRTLTHIIAGGGNTAKAGVGNAEYWTGYAPDEMMFLLAGAAAAESRPEAEFYLDLAAQVAEQFVIASIYDGNMFAPKNFKWIDESGDLGIAAADAYFWDNPAYDDSDAPRSLLAGLALRAARIATDGNLPPGFQLLEKWVEEAGEASKEGDEYCIQFFRGGEPFEPSCGDNFYNLGLAGSLFVDQPDLIEEMLGRALGQFTPEGIPQGAEYPGVYRTVRPLRLAAAGLGLDASVFNLSYQIGEAETFMTSTPRPSSTVTATQASEGFMYDRVQELPVWCEDDSGEAPFVVYQSSLFMPKFTKRHDPSGIVEDHDQPIGTGKTVVCFDPDSGRMYQIAMWADSEVEQSQLKAYHQPGPDGDYMDHGIRFLIGTESLSIPPQPHGIPGFFPAYGPLPPDEAEIRP